MPRLRSLVRTVSLTAATATIVAVPTEKRVALIFTSHATVDITLGFNQNVTVGGGLTLYAKGTPLEFLRQYHGDAVTQPWFAISSANSVITFLETIED